MSEDPRWQLAVDAVQEMTASDQRNAGRALELWQTYVTTLDAIAGDGSADDRVQAQAILDDIAAECRNQTGLAVATLSEIAESDTADPQLRQQARQTLQTIAVELRARGQDISHWPITPTSGKPN